MIKDKYIGKQKDGFTLVEVIVVFVILVILCAILVPSFNNYIENKQAEECVNNRKALLVLLGQERVKDPASAMSSILAKPEGAAIICPDQGEYSLTGDQIICSKHGSVDIPLPDNDTTSKVPGRSPVPATY